MPEVNQKKIAQRLNLTPAAVCKALKGDADISRATVLAVRAAVRTMGYRRNRIASSLVCGRTHLIGVLLSSFFNNFQGQLLDGMEREARSRGFKILPSQTARDRNTDDFDLDELLQYKVEGLIVMPRYARAWQNTCYPRLLQQGVKIVLVNQKAPLPGICSVNSDDARGAREAVRCLIRRGHRRIMFLRPPYSVTSADLREQGFREALRAAGIPVREEWIVRAIAPPITDEMIAFIRKAALTAAFCFNDGCAVRLVLRLQKLGRRIPDDFSIVGYGDDILHSEFQHLPLTTVSQSPTQMGEESARRIIAMIESGETSADFIAPTRLIERASAGSAPADLGPEPRADESKAGKQVAAHAGKD